MFYVIEPLRIVGERLSVALKRNRRLDYCDAPIVQQPCRFFEEPVWVRCVLEDVKRQEHVARRQTDVWKQTNADVEAKAFSKPAPHAVVCLDANAAIAPFRQLIQQGAGRAPYFDHSVRCRRESLDQTEPVLQAAVRSIQLSAFLDCWVSPGLLPDLPIGIVGIEAAQFLVDRRPAIHVATTIDALAVTRMPLDGVQFAPTPASMPARPPDVSPLALVDVPVREPLQPAAE